MKKLVDENIVEIFDNMINKTNKREILIMIKSDILEFCGEISPIELEFLSENIYDYCCLMVNQITDTKIMWYITRKMRNIMIKYRKEIEKNFVLNLI